MTNDKALAEVKEQFPVVSAEDVRKFFCEKATEKEVAMFLNIAKLNNLNPFKREIYIVKYGTYPASILTGYEVYLKRAERTGKYAGFKVWVEGSVTDNNLKACIEVYRKDWEKPLTHEVEYNEYVGRTSAGIPTRFWKDKPKTMLKKVVISQAMRFAFPDELAGMPYTADEINDHQSEPTTKSEPIEVPSLPPESQEKPVNTSRNDERPADEDIPSDETLQAETGRPEVETPIIRITEPQRKRLFAVAREFGWTKDSLKEYLKVSHNLESTRDIPVKKYDGIISFLQTASDK